MNTKDQKPEPIALFDLDNTLADFVGSMRAKMAEVSAPGEQSYYDEQDDEPPHITARRRLIKRVPGFWKNLPQLEIGMVLLKEAIRLSFDVTILTKAPRNNFMAWSEKAEWCWNNLLMKEHGIQISIVEDKGLHYGKILVDDWPKYALRWLEHRPRGTVIMPAHDYNKDFSHPNVIRADLQDAASMARAFAAMAEIRSKCQDLAA